MTATLDPAACTRCGVILGTETWSDGSVRYIHTSPADHLPEPAPPGDLDNVIHRCDFCNAVNPGWIVPVQNFRSITKDGRPALDSAGDWAACDRCALYVTREDWDTLIRYGLRGAGAGNSVIRPELDEGAMDDARAFYRAMHASMTGPPIHSKGMAAKSAAGRRRKGR